MFVSPERMQQEVAGGATEYTGPLPSAEMLDEDAVRRAARLARARTRASAADSRMGVGTQAFRFIISGGVSAIFDLGLTWILQMIVGLGPTAARTFGFILGTLVAYFINRRWTFQAEPSKRRFLAVAALYAVTYFVNVGLHRIGFEIFTDDLGWADSIAIVVAYLIAQTTATVVNFIVQRTVIFRVV